MDALGYVIDGVDLVKHVHAFFTESSAGKDDFINPFINYIDSKGKQKSAELENFTEDCVVSKLNSLKKTPSSFILAGETEVEDPKSGALQYFYVIKLYLKGMPQGYIYSMPFKKQDDGSKQISNLRYVGSEPNCYLPYSEPEGEMSSCNALKLDPKVPYDYRAAFLIGHIDEKRLWHDVSTLISDMYCKLGPDSTRKFELIFEISKFGSLTETIQKDYKTFETFFINTFVPSFPNINGVLQLENTKLG